ncbi:MOSC N-terminal beta barrel domain-containing protein [Actinokineospora sp. NBRC 105648]|uniref:MOSC domain-containing protein n=1 Tax=Actinokineospora sp. NBRC 105648 TaxID=3032206 RepID=UPI0024A341CB|nr:MOSC N-terminal beta barrel domain-containing protein [Actinokineospora sp. NBRC 105648]GLZ37610.1 molybdenum cofactor sulfurase [Actinokineospora sp. NBRC 105648]
MPTVSALTYYPVKGFRGVPLTRAEAVETGLRDDRLLMVVDAADGTFVSQRKLPAMAAVQARVVGGVLVLALPGMPDAEIEITPDGPQREVSLFNKWFGPAVDQGDAAAKWCTTALDRDVRLVRVPPTHDRPGWGTHPGKVGFGDAHAVLLTSESSLEGLNTRITEAGADPVPMDRFRPNIVVSGWPDPHIEDTVLKLTVGTVELGYSVRAIRCAVPTVDQTTGAKRGPEPTRTLATYRRDPDYPGVSFGAKFAVLTPGTLSVGDEIQVTHWQ